MSIIQRLRELEATATPGPWEAFAGSVIRGTREAYHHPLNDDGTPYYRYVGIRESEDAVLIAEMRNRLPKLLAVVEAARTYIDNNGGENGPTLWHALAALEDK